MHEILIIVLILGIVAVQIMIASDASKKISRFKKIIPIADNFATVKVYIPESQIKYIKVDDILADLKSYSSPRDQNIHEIFHEEEIEIQNLNYVEVDDDGISEFPLPNNLEENDNSLVWIRKDSKEKRIEYRLLKSFELLGWNRIN